MTRRSPCTEADVVAARDAGARTSSDLAAALNITTRSALRWMDKVPGFIKQTEKAGTTTPDQVIIVSALLRDQVPDKWVAETAGVSRFVVSDWKAALGLTGRRGGGEWAKVLREIKRDPELLAWHQEFAPK